MDNTRDVKLRVGVETAGSAELRTLAGDLRGVGTAGGAAAPELERLTRELADAKDNTEAFRQAEAAARSDLAAQKRALDDKRDALARLRATTEDAARNSDTFRQKVAAERVAILDARAAVREQQAALEAASAATKKAATAEAELASGLKRAAVAYRETGEAASTSASQQTRSNKSVADGLREIQGQLNTIRNLAAAATGGQFLGGVIGDVGRTADAYANLAARIKLVTGEGAAFDSTFQGVFDVATRTNSAVEETGALFTRVAAAGKAIGLSTRDALSLTETINQAIQLSGASAESSQAAITQLVQGLQSGGLRGDEFNSVMEQAPRLAQALAQGLGVTTGELRKLAEAGQLTSTAVIGALQGQATAIGGEFSKLPQTIGRALQNLSTEWTRYVGEVDKANGISATAASVLNGLATHLDTVGTVLFSLGKATAAYQALKLAKTFVDIGGAAKVATTEIAAMTAAQNANATASAIAAGGVGKFGALVSGVKTFGLLAVLTNFREIGTAIGEGVAKLAGYDRAMKDAELTMQANEAIARQNAAAIAELAQRKQLAAEAALGLTTESKALVAEFDHVRQKGGSVSDALDKVRKSLELGDISSITTAAAALDALAVKGKISAQQVRESFVVALKDIDLGKFATEAGAAFDQSEQGARRLKAALDAVALESLRRAGTSTEELRTGFSAAVTSALNDLDALQKSLSDLGARSDDTGRLLAAGLDKALSAANTERAVREVTARIEDLGRQGALSGEQFARAMESARQKLDDLKPGVNSLDEALRNFGLKSREGLQATADKMRASWEIIRTSATTSLADKRRAFEQYADAAIAANGGVESSEIRLARHMLELQEAAAPVGTVIARSMATGRDAIDATTASTDRLLEAQDRAARQQAVINGTKTAGRIGPDNKLSEDTKAGSQGLDRFNGIALPTEVDFTDQLLAKAKAGQLTAEDLPGLKTALAANTVNRQTAATVMRQSAGAYSLDALRQMDEQGRLLASAIEKLAGAKLNTPTAGSTAAGSSTTRTIKIQIGNTSKNVNVASDADADALQSVLQQLAGAAARSI